MQQQGRYTILREIAAGGTATVFLAEDSVLHRKVALKKLHPHLLNRPEMVRRFEKEAVAVASLSHENVIRIFDYGQEDKGVFLAMEYVDGVSLESLLATAGGSLPCLAAMSLFLQLFDGLSAAHARGICHRDIKPSNVLVDRQGCVRIADFGIAFLTEETSITRTGSYLGTPGYSSPEQAQGRTITVKTDIFAAGILLYRALAGRLPFDAETPHAVLMSIMEKTPDNLIQANRRLIPGLAGLVERMLAKGCEARPTAVECAAELAEMARNLGLPLDAERVRRLYADPEAYAAQDRLEVAECYLGHARLAHAKGQSREALKLYAVAEAFAEPGGEMAAEAGGYLLRMRKAERRRGAFACAGAALAILLLAWLIYSLPRQPRDPDATAAVDAEKPPPVPTPASIPASAPAAAGEVTGMLPEGGVPAEAPPAGQKEPAGTAVPSPAPAASSPATPVATPARVASVATGSAESERTVPAAAVAAVQAPRGLSEQEAAPAPSKGYLWVRTNPPFVRIRVDGLDLGKTPLAAPLILTAGLHRVDLERDGCVPSLDSIIVAAADTLLLRRTLERRSDP